MNRLEILIPAWPPKELWPNYSKPGPGWDMRAWQGKLARLKEEYGLTVYAYATNAVRQQGWQAPDKCRLILTCLNTLNRWPDDDSVASAFKCGRDTLVSAGALKGDGPQYITELVVRHERHPTVKGIRVEIEEAE